MIKRLYVEHSIRDHPRTAHIIKKTGLTPVFCNSYREILNPRTQDFRLQKKNQSLILAQKQHTWIHEAQDGYRIAPGRHYYFSHLLNCPYDCRYCFLQGKYRGAHLVLFINYEAFADAITPYVHLDDTPSVFFTGYDSDSLALEPISGFVQFMLPVFARHPDTLFELRTKSTQIRTLLRQEPLPNCVVAFSLSPQQIRATAEPGIPALEKQLAVIKKLGERGWRLGIRFEPLLYWPEFRAPYKELFHLVFSTLSDDWLHSVTLSPFHLPASYFRRAARLLPEQPLYARPMKKRDGLMICDDSWNMVDWSRHILRSYLPEEKLYVYDPAPTRVAEGAIA